MWALYQLIAAKYKSHSARIRKTQFDASHFLRALWTHPKELSLAQHWTQQFDVAEGLAAQRNWTFDANIVRVRYEELTNERTRVAALMRILRHLYALREQKANDEYFAVPSGAGTETALEWLSEDELRQRIECAFAYSDRMHRDDVKREKDGNESWVSMDEAYARMGAEVALFLRESAEPFGYECACGHRDLQRGRIECAFAYSDQMDRDY